MRKSTYYAVVVTAMIAVIVVLTEIHAPVPVFDGGTVLAGLTAAVLCWRRGNRK